MSAPGADFHQLMEATFFQSAALTYPGMKIYTPNAKWIEPMNQDWFAFHVLQGDSFNTNIGNKVVERTTLVLHISVYLPVETNERRAWEKAETAARWFANKDFRVGPGQYANFRAPNIKSSADPKTGKFRVIATVPGYRDVQIVRP